MKRNTSFVHNWYVVSTRTLNWFILVAHLLRRISDLLASIRFWSHKNSSIPCAAVRTSFQTRSILLTWLSIISINTYNVLFWGWCTVENIFVITISIHVLLTYVTLAREFLNWFSHTFRWETFWLTLSNNKSFRRTDSVRRSFLNLNFRSWVFTLLISITNLLHSLLRVKWATQECVLAGRCGIWIALISLFDLSFGLLFKKLLLWLPNRNVWWSTNANFCLNRHLINSLMIVSCSSIFPRHLFAHLILKLGIREVSTTKRTPSIVGNRFIFLSWKSFSSYASIGVSLSFGL